MAFSLLPKTYDEVKTYLVTKIGEKYPVLGAYLGNSFLFIFIDVIAWGIALFMDIADNLWQENHLFSAVKYENARKQAKFYGHEAARKKSAQGTIKVGMNSSFNALPLESITLNQYDALKINGIDFLVAETTTLSSNPLDNSYDGLPVGIYYVEVPVIQGQLITVDNVASGIQNEQFNVSDYYVENSTYIVTVDSEVYTKVDSFFTSNATDKHYTLENKALMSGVDTTFGDGYRGRQLASGETVTMKYIKTDDLDGQIKSIGFEVTFIETYTYSDLTPVTLYGTTISQMVGAEDVETIESIRYWGQIAASTLDEKAFQDSEIQLALQQFGGILISKALSEYDISPDSPDQNTMNVVRLLIVPNTGTTYDDVTKQRIREYLRPKMDFTDFIQFIDVEYIDIYFVVDTEVTSNTPQDIASQMDTYLQTTYALGQLDLGASLDHSTVVNQLKTEFADYIHRFNLTLWVTETDTSGAIQTGNIITRTLKIGGLRAGQNNIKSCKVIASFNDGADKTETIQDDGSGNFVPVATGVSSFISSGTINYQTGLVTLNLKGGVVSVSSLEYQYETYDVDGVSVNVDIKYNQIIRYNKSYIPIEYV